VRVLWTTLGRKKGIILLGNIKPMIILEEVLFLHASILEKVRGEFKMRVFF